MQTQIKPSCIKKFLLGSTGTDPAKGFPSLELSKLLSLCQILSLRLGSLGCFPTILVYFKYTQAGRIPNFSGFRIAKSMEIQGLVSLSVLQGVWLQSSAEGGSKENWGWLSHKIHFTNRCGRSKIVWKTWAEGSEPLTAERGTEMLLYEGSEPLIRPLFFQPPFPTTQTIPVTMTHALDWPWGLLPGTASFFRSFQEAEH